MIGQKYKVNVYVDLPESPVNENIGRLFRYLCYKLYLTVFYIMYCKLFLFVINNN